MFRICSFGNLKREANNCRRLLYSSAADAVFERRGRPLGLYFRGVCVYVVFVGVVCPRGARI